MYVKFKRIFILEYVDQYTTTPLDVLNRKACSSYTI